MELGNDATEDKLTEHESLYKITLTAHRNNNTKQQAKAIIIIFY